MHTGYVPLAGSAYKTCHDAAPNKAGGKIKECRRSGKVNTAAHEVYGPGNQLNVGADGGVAGGLGAASNGNRRTGLQALAFQLGWDIVVAHLVLLATCKTKRSFWPPDSALTR
jgi:hypothetical protein